MHFWEECISAVQWSVYSVFIWEVDIVCLAVKRKCVVLRLGYSLYNWNEDTCLSEKIINTLCISAKRSICVHLLRRIYCVYLRRGYVYFCEVYIFFISEQMIYCFYLRIHFVYRFYLPRRIFCVNLRRGYDVYFWKVDIVCFLVRGYNVHFC